MMLALSLFSLFSFIAAWLYSRRRQDDVTITDIFSLAFIVIFVPFFIFNPNADARLNTTAFSDAIAARGSIGFSVFLLIGAGVFILRSFHPRQSQTRIVVSSNSIRWIAVIAFAISILLFVALLTGSTEFPTFRLQSVRWILGDLNTTEYAVYRRSGSGAVLDGIVGRLRYSLLPVLFLLTLSPFITTGAFASASLLAVLFVIALPLSLSKLPIVYYLAYAALFTYLIRKNTLSLKKAALGTLVGIAAATVIISVLYLIQYRNAPGYTSLFDQPIRLAIARIWGESYSVPLRYFAAYPDVLPFSGWSGVGFSAKILGLEFRNPDLEVTNAILGPDSGSNPGICFLAGYATFGFVGLALFSLACFVLLWAIDAFLTLIKTQLCFFIFFAIMSLNVLFLLQISLPTTLFSYGLAIVPVTVKAADMLLIKIHNGTIDSRQPS